MLFRPGAVAAETQIEPGRWIARREVLAITYPEMPAEMKRQVKQTFENDPDPEECIAPAVASARQTSGCSIRAGRASARWSASR
jgi:hypothetical protein